MSSVAATAPRIALLSGGVGGAKLALGLYHYLRQRYGTAQSLAIIANSADDCYWLGLRVCPDADILLYTLCGLADEQQGWGLAGDTQHVLSQVARLGGADWFQLGDRDLGLGLLRTHWLREGLGLAQVFARFGAALGLECTLLPACEAYAPTQVRTPQGWMHLQEYLVRQRTAPPVLELAQPGLENAQPAPGVLEAIAACELLILAPSNPFLSIQPILETPGVRQAIMARLQAGRSGQRGGALAAPRPQTGAATVPSAAEGVAPPGELCGHSAAPRPQAGGAVAPSAVAGGGTQAGRSGGPAEPRPQAGGPQERPFCSLAVSPVLGGRVLKGPLAQLLLARGEAVSPLSVLQAYRGLVEAFVLDTQDAALATAVQAQGVRPWILPIAMHTPEHKIALARQLLELASQPRQRLD